MMMVMTMSMDSIVTMISMMIMMNYIDDDHDEENYDD
jgi:hypothetical protein